MGQEIEISQRAELPMLKPAVAARLNQFVASWKPTDEVPDGAIPYLQPAITIAEREVAPVGPMGVAVLLDPLWAIFPMPSDEALDVWHQTLDCYPADLIESAVKRLIATRTWDRDPPLPGQIVAGLKADFQARNDKLLRLRAIDGRAKRQAPKPAGGKSWHDLTPEEQVERNRRHAEALASIAAAASANVMPIHPHEAMSEAAKAEARAASLAKDGEE